jgi:hypothetical protein
MKKGTGRKIRPYDLDQVSYPLQATSILKIRPSGGSAYDLTRIGSLNRARDVGGAVTTVKRKL